MRNLIIYELEADYANYLQALGAPSRLVRKYAYRNAVLPQMSGLALALGAVVGGALVTEIVFGYPGLGTLIITALQNRDYFLLQGLFLFIIIGVLDRELHRRHRLRDRRSAHAHGNPGVVMATAESQADLVATPEVAVTGEGAALGEDGGPRGARSEILTSRSATEARRRALGRLAFLALAIVGPWLTDADAVRVRLPARASRPRASTGSARLRPGQDVFTQFVYGLRSSFIVGALGGCVAALIGHGDRLRQRATSAASSTSSSACSRTSCS